MYEGEQNARASYGITLSELSKLRVDQSMSSVEMVLAVNNIKQTGDKRHELVEKLAEGYKVAKVEFTEVFHIILDNPLFDENSGDRIDRGPVVQKFSKAAFALSEKNGGFMSKLSFILHNPFQAELLLKNPQEVKVEVKEVEKAISAAAELKAEELAIENQILKEQIEKMNEVQKDLQDEIQEAKSEEVLKSEEDLDDELDKFLKEEEKKNKGKEAKND